MPLTSKKSLDKQYCLIFRVPFRGWRVTQGGAQGFARRFALGYFTSLLSKLAGTQSRVCPFYGTIG
jgi:hypothetical protein